MKKFAFLISALCALSALAATVVLGTLDKLKWVQHSPGIYIADFGGAQAYGSGGDNCYTTAGWVVHTYTTVGTSTFEVVGGELECEVLIVGGGGTGSEYQGGGGGGGVIFTNVMVGAFSEVVVGAGLGTNRYSAFGALVAPGGGHCMWPDGLPGGCGGGGSIDWYSPGIATVGGAGTHGGSGGSGYVLTDPGTGNQSGGGGGGGGAKPEDGQIGLLDFWTPGGRGGDGFVCGISGTNQTYGGGGGGWVDINELEYGGFYSPGGTGGGGGDGSIDVMQGVDGLGGGGAGARGGSGIVIIRYRAEGAQ